MPRPISRKKPSPVHDALRWKVTINHGIVGLVGRVRTDKERSSMAFKVGQTAGVGAIDNRVTVGNGVEGSGEVSPRWTSR